MKKAEKVEQVGKPLVDDNKWEGYITDYNGLKTEDKKNFLEVFYQELRDAYAAQDRLDPQTFRAAVEKIRARTAQLNNLRDTLNSQNSEKVARYEEFRLRREAELKARQDHIVSLRESLGPNFA